MSDQGEQNQQHPDQQEQSQPNPVEHNADSEVQPQSGHPSQAEGEDTGLATGADA